MDIEITTVDRTIDAKMSHTLDHPADGPPKIYASPDEGVVGVSLGNEVLAVTANQGGFTKLPDATITQRAIDYGWSLDHVAQGVHYAVDNGHHVDPLLTSNRQVLQHLLTTDAPEVPQPDAPLILSYLSSAESYSATVVHPDPQTPSVDFGIRHAENPTPEALIGQLNNAGHALTPKHIEHLHELGNDVRRAFGAHNIVGTTSPDTGQRHLHLITPRGTAVEIPPTGDFSPAGYNWGYHGSGTNETAQQIADATLGAQHPNHSALTAKLREGLATVDTNSFRINLSTAAKPDQPLLIGTSTHPSPEAAQSIGRLAKPAVAPPAPRLAL